MFGCGTLHVQTAAEDGTIVLDDVPDVEQVYAEMTELLFGARSGWLARPSAVRMSGDARRLECPAGIATSPSWSWTGRRR